MFMWISKFVGSNLQLQHMKLLMETYLRMMQTTEELEVKAEYADFNLLYAYRKQQYLLLVNDINRNV